MTHVLKVIQKLYNNGIGSGIQATARGRILVWLGDQVIDDVNDMLQIFGPEQLSDTAQWLHSQACKAHLDSAYARLHRTGRLLWTTSPNHPAASNAHWLA